MAAVTSTTQYTSKQVEELWRKAGGSPKYAQLMAAIATAESSRHPTAENVAGHSTEDLTYAPPYTSYSPTGDYSIGLFQENFYQSLGPERANEWSAKYGGPSEPTAFAQWLRTQPVVQAKIAKELLGPDASGITNWEGDPAARAYMQGGNAAIQPYLGNYGNTSQEGFGSVVQAGINAATGGIGGTATSLIPGLNLTSGITAFLYQATFILVGAGLMLVGLFLVARSLMNVGAPGIVGQVEGAVRIRQAGQRTAESRRASMVREGQAETRLAGQEAQRDLSSRRLDVQERIQANREAQQAAAA